MPKSDYSKKFDKLFSSIQEEGAAETVLASVQKLPSFSWECDANGLYTSCSNEATDLLGYTSDQIIGNPLLSLWLDPDDQAKLRASLQSEVFPCDVELKLHTKKHKVANTRWNLFQQKSQDGTLSGYQGMVLFLEEPRKEEKEEKEKKEKTEDQQPEGFSEETLEKVDEIQNMIGVQTGKLPDLDEIEQRNINEVTTPVVRTPKKREVKPKLVKKPQIATSKLKAIQTAPLPPVFSAIPSSQDREITTISESIGGMELVDDEFKPSSAPWSEQSELSLLNNETISLAGDSESPAILTTPLRMRDQQSAVIEVLDSSAERNWTQDDRLLIQEISNQLGLALENAQLYSTIQKELRERVRAEEETLRRNKELSVLNQIGQRLTKLVGQEEIFDTISTSAQELLSQGNLLVSIADPKSGMLRFPVCVVDGEKQELDARHLGDGYQEKILKEKNTLLLNSAVGETLTESALDHPKNKPLSMLAVPLLVADRAIGVISVYDFMNENAFTPVQGELLSTIAAQAATALENTNLFTEIRDSLELIEERERYQFNVTNAAAELNEKGSAAVDFLLASLLTASNADLVFYAPAIENPKTGINWVATSFVSQNPEVKSLPAMPVGQFPNWFEALKTRPYLFCTRSTCTDPERNFLVENNIQSIMLYAIRLENQPVGVIGIETVNEESIWKTEQMDVLSIATDAFNNILIRENLLKRVQDSLSETESLYTASHNLALADDVQAMLTAIVDGVNIPAINRGVLVLFDYNESNQISRMYVEANYHTGKGTPPPARGTEYLVSLYKSLFSIENPVFYDDFLEIQLEKSLQEILIRQNIRSMAVLPLWASDKQLGVVLLQASQQHTFTPKEIRTYPPLTGQMSTSVQNLLLFEETQAALSETELLYKISSGIAKSKSMEELLILVGENVLPEASDTLWLCTCTTNPQTKELETEIVGSYTSNKEYLESGVKLDSDVISFVNVNSAEPKLFSEIGSSNLPASTQGIFKNLGINSGAVFALQSGGSPVGLLIASSKRPSELSPDDVHTLQIVTNSIAVAIERQRLLFEAQKHALELQTAAEIARDTTSTLSLEILLNRIVNLLRERFSLYHVSIFLLDDTNEYAIIQESTGNIGQELKKRNFRLGVGSKSVIGNCTSTGETVIVNDVAHHDLFYPNPLLPDTQSELGIPLKISGKVIGALDLQARDPNAFSEEEVAILQILSDQISVAIDNAKAYSVSQQAVEEMRELDRVKSQFLANMSHELRTPLNSVIGFSRVILKGIDGPINDVQQQDITAIYNSGMHLLNMINEILDLSKIDAGKMELQIEEVHLADVINAAITNTSGLVKDKPIELVQKIPANLPTVKADEIRINQVLINLISNAVKFTEKGSITVEASVSKSPDNEAEILVTVADTGIGIAIEDQVKLFQRFSQVDDSPTRKTGGTGLGLSICRSLVELHGGRIGLLSSEVDKGSVFYFTLPLPDFIPAYDLSSPAEDTNIILSIDDDAQVIALYDRFLKTQGFEVIPLTDPSNAVQKARELKPFAITLDVMMPQKDGWQVLNELKQDPETRDIPILICSILQEEEKGYSLGASEYLVKPFLQDDLINAIRRLNKDGSVHEIMVIDDDPNELEAIQKMLSDDDSIHLTCAEGGIEALSALETITPDVIILDLFMPRMNGFELLEKLHDEARLNRVPVVILTGDNLDEEQQKQVSELSKELIAKSTLKEDELLNTIRKTLASLSSTQPKE
jgi:signal transduction histidine kinase/CheY-like chemotaxis protein